MKSTGGVHAPGHQPSPATGCYGRALLSTTPHTTVESCAVAMPHTAAARQLRLERRISAADQDWADRLNVVCHGPRLDEFYMPIDRISIPI
jgi:hypothetical protein